MDRLVNIRMTADLSQIIQQFTQLNNTINTVTSSMGGVTGSNMNIGGMAGGMNLPGAMGGVAGAGGTMPGTGVTNPRTSNRGGGAAANSYSSIGRADGRNVTSMMFGLSQIGFALEDYQYAGWRGVMNNVPWIANALTSMVAPAAAPYALLGTAIGVPLANMAYENMSPQTRNSISQMFGGLGMSADETRSAEIDQLEQKISRFSGLDYRRRALEAQLLKLQRSEGLSDIFNQFANNPFEKQVTEDQSSAFSRGMSQFSEAGGTGPLGKINNAINSEFNANIDKRMQRELQDWYESSSTVGVAANTMFSMTKARLSSFFSGKSDVEEFKEDFLGDFRAKANSERESLIQRVSSDVGEAIKSQDKEKLKKAIGRPYVPNSVRTILKELLAEIEKAEAEALAIKDSNYQVSQMTPTERADRSEGGDMFVGPMQRGVLKAKQQEEIARGTVATAEESFRLRQRQEERAGTAVNRYSSQIEAIIAGSRNIDRLLWPDTKGGEVAENRIRQFLLGEGVARGDIATFLTPEFRQQIQDRIDNKKKPDEKLWEENHKQWIANVKSDILQAQKAAFAGGSFNQKVFNSYIYRIKTKIRDDLIASGVRDQETYAEMIFNAAFNEAKQSYEDATARAQNIVEQDAGRQTLDKYKKHGWNKITNVQNIVQNMAMQSLMGEMSDDLTAVYGNAQANTFMMNRIYQQQIRRRQIMLNRFQR
jgi:hypothetical protein